MALRHINDVVARAAIVDVDGDGAVRCNVYIYPRSDKLRRFEPEIPIPAGIGDKHGICAGRIIKPCQ